MEIYTIAHMTTQTVSMGDYIDIEGIFKKDDYYTGDFHPCFCSKQTAERYNKNLPEHKQGKVVALTLVMS